MFCSSMPEDWVAWSPSTKFGEKAGNYAAAVTGRFALNLCHVLLKGMDEDRAEKHYIRPVMKKFYEIYHSEEGINPYSAEIHLSPSVIVLAQKDIERKMEDGRNIISSREYERLGNIADVLKDARECVGPVYQRINTPREDGMDATTYFFLMGKISAEEAAEMHEIAERRTPQP